MFKQADCSIWANSEREREQIIPVHLSYWLFPNAFVSQSQSRICWSKISQMVTSEWVVPSRLRSQDLVQVRDSVFFVLQWKYKFWRENAIEATLNMFTNLQVIKTSAFVAAKILPWLSCYLDGKRLCFRISK